MKELFHGLTNRSVALMQKYLPDSFIFAILLTFVVYICVLPVSKGTPLELIDAWYGGFWAILTFTVQISMTLIGGTILATTSVFQKLLQKLATFIKSPGQAIILVTVVAMIASFISWAFGLVLGAFFAREIVKKVKGIHYPLLVASAYVGFLIWHGGLSGSIPLKIASVTDLAKITNGALTEAIPTTQTIFSSFNLTIIAILFITLPFLLRAMHPKKEDVVEIDPKLLYEEEDTQRLEKENMTPAQKLENARWINVILAIAGFAFIIPYFYNKGLALNLNIINFVFLFAAILLHGTPIKVVKEVNKAAKSLGPILLQFPFYAGIMGLMKFAGADGISMASFISQIFIDISNEVTFPLFSFISAGTINFFVPSGGGQWVIQAPVIMPAAMELGVSPAKAAMSIAWGDAWTNMIQPFWALPLLGIAKLGAKDIMGYCVLVLVYSGIIISCGLMFL